jgi:hypothetical protein
MVESTVEFLSTPRYESREFATVNGILGGDEARSLVGHHSPYEHHPPTDQVVGFRTARREVPTYELDIESSTANPTHNSSIR